MKAVLCKQYGPPEKLVVEDIDSPQAGPGEVKIAIRACGVNFPDTLIIENKYQFKPPLPFAPGGEVAGDIVSLGKGVEGVAVGDRVIAVCGFGGFAEELVVGADRVAPIPDSMDYITAAGFTMTYGTSYYALKQRARLKGGETLLVLGAAGGVGLAAVEIGRVMGARVIAAAGSDEKLEFCRQHGADETINYNTENLKEKTRELTGGVGADVIYDAVGGDAFDQAIRCINWEGRLLVIGFASGRIPQLPVNLALLKGCQIVGVFWGAFTVREPATNAQNLAELAAWHAEGKIAAHVDVTYPLEKAADALAAMIARKAKGKIVLTVDGAGR